jgi:Flp pilus assembly protein protease CpaA
MGAGDVKYITTLFLLIPRHYHEELTATMIIATILVGFILIIIRFISHGKEFVRMLSIGDFSVVNLLFGSKFSYAPVILITWLVWGFGRLNDFI